MLETVSVLNEAIVGCSEKTPILFNMSVAAVSFLINFDFIYK